MSLLVQQKYSHNPGQNYVDTLAVYDLFTYYLAFTWYLPE